VAELRIGATGVRAAMNPHKDWPKDPWANPEWVHRRNDVQVEAVIADNAQVFTQFSAK
jgi:hypothetical protein